MTPISNQPLSVKIFVKRRLQEPPLVETPQAPRCEAQAPTQKSQRGAQRGRAPTAEKAVPMQKKADAIAQEDDGLFAAAFPDEGSEAQAPLGGHRAVAVLGRGKMYSCIFVGICRAL